MLLLAATPGISQHRQPGCPAAGFCPPERYPHVPPALPGRAGNGAAGSATGRNRARTAAVAYYQAVTYARDERLALADELEKLGPEAATLCDGWRTADLAAHLVLRERRPDAAIGVMGGPLAGYTRKLLRSTAERTPYPMLIEQVRTGPPRLSLFGIPGADARLNFGEFFVHHEDVRRAQPGWEPRDLDPGMTEEIWSQLPRARLVLRKVPVGIEFARDDVREPSDGQPTVRITVRRRPPVVTVIGGPAELLMWSFGRTGAAHVKLEGAPADVTALTQARWGI